MEKTPQHEPKIPLSEKLKTPLDIVGIRTNEQPDYDVITKDGHVEVRKYKKTLIAQVKILGDYESAKKEGFLTLANYIFGDNQKQANIPMTAPVFQEKRSENSQTMAMTAPVIQEQDEAQTGWVTSFVVPEKFDRNSVPQPTNSEIQFKELPERNTAVFTYSGNNTEDKMKRAEEKLREWISTTGKNSTSSIRWAQYDPPFAIPFLKRNEAQIDIG